MLPIALRLIMGYEHNIPFNHRRQLDAIVQLGGKRAVVTLMDHISSTRSRSTHNFRNNRRTTTTSGDAAMAAIVKLTGQSLNDYGFYTGADWNPAHTMPGFVKDADRTAAQKKLRAWWAKHKKEYENVPKISLKDDPDDPDHPSGVPNIIRKLGGL